MVAVKDDENITVVPDIESIDELQTLHWKRRAYWGNIPPNYHACLAYIFDVEPRTLPSAITSKGVITSDGYIIASGTKSGGESFMGGFIGSFSDFNEAMKTLASKSMFSDADRTEFSALLNDWVGTSYSNNKFAI